MYTRIALGKNSAMDVVSGESSGGQGQLLILYPMLFALQGLEMYIGKLHIAVASQIAYWRADASGTCSMDQFGRIWCFVKLSCLAGSVCKSKAGAGAWTQHVLGFSWRCPASHV